MNWLDFPERQKRFDLEIYHAQLKDAADTFWKRQYIEGKIPLEKLMEKEKNLPQIIVIK